NYDNLSQFLRLLHEQGGKNMSYRNMTVSTSGIVPAIAMFADDFPQVNLAVSLHRLTDSGRNSIMPSTGNILWMNCFRRRTGIRKRLVGGSLSNTR
ncbi:MAG: hypothetical protein ACLU7V_05815, partial [Anaerovoracaceae bacterium]